MVCGGPLLEDFPIDNCTRRLDAALAVDCGVAWCGVALSRRRGKPAGVMLRRDSCPACGGDGNVALIDRTGATGMTRMRNRVQLCSGTLQAPTARVAMLARALAHERMLERMALARGSGAARVQTARQLCQGK